MFSKLLSALYEPIRKGNEYRLATRGPSRWIKRGELKTPPSAIGVACLYAASLGEDFLLTTLELNAT